MMFFLTSSPVGDDGRLFGANQFKARLASSLKGKVSCLFVASDPTAHERTEGFASFIQSSLQEAGIEVSSLVVLDDRNQGQVGRLLKKSDLVVLSGGHVPTQNAFFSSIPLRTLLTSYKGVVMGISAGTMNSAEEVYCPPEEEGEALDPTFRRYYRGLGLTKVKVIPHYNSEKDAVLDGMRVYEDIIYPDSHNETFFIFPDGTYLYKDEEGERICGECWTLRNGHLTKISEEGEEVMVEQH